MRFCSMCGRQLTRKRYQGGGLEPLHTWRRRRYCDRECALKGMWGDKARCWTKEGIVSELHRRSEAGYAPSSNEVSQGMRKKAVALFGSWHEACQAAGVIPVGSYSKPASKSIHFRDVIPKRKQPQLETALTLIAMRVDDKQRARVPTKAAVSESLSEWHQWASLCRKHGFDPFGIL